jgi:hypothetical protein
MSVRFQHHSENQTDKNEKVQMNFYEKIEKFNIQTEEINNNSTQSNNENLAPQDSETKIFKRDENKNINISNSDLIEPNILKKENNCYSLTKSLLSKYRLVWIVLLICVFAILLIIFALNRGNNELKSK